MTSPRSQDTLLWDPPSVAGAEVGTKAAEGRLAEQVLQPQGRHLAPADGLQVAGHEAGHDVAPALHYAKNVLAQNSGAAATLAAMQQCCVSMRRVVTVAVFSHHLQRSQQLHHTRQHHQAASSRL